MYWVILLVSHRRPKALTLVHTLLTHCIGSPSLHRSGGNLFPPCLADLPLTSCLVCSSLPSPSGNVLFDTQPGPRTFMLAHSTLALGQSCALERPHRFGVSLSNFSASVPLVLDSEAALKSRCPEISTSSAKARAATPSVLGDHFARLDCSFSSLSQATLPAIMASSATIVPASPSLSLFTARSCRALSYDLSPEPPYGSDCLGPRPSHKPVAVHFLCALKRLQEHPFVCIIFALLNKQTCINRTLTQW